MGERMEGGRGGGTAEGREDVRRREGGKEGGRKVVYYRSTLHPDRGAHTSVL